MNFKWTKVTEFNRLMIGIGCTEQRRCSSDQLVLFCSLFKETLIWNGQSEVTDSHLKSRFIIFAFYLHSKSLQMANTIVNRWVISEFKVQIRTPLSLWCHCTCCGHRQLLSGHLVIRRWCRLTFYLCQSIVSTNHFVKDENFAAVYFVPLKLWNGLFIGPFWKA